MQLFTFGSLYINSFNKKNSISIVVFRKMRINDPNDIKSRKFIVVMYGMPFISTGYSVKN